MANAVPPVPPQQKRTSPWVWVAVGCGGVLVIASIVAALVGMFVVGKVREVAEEMEEDPIAATAGLLAAANPEIELVEADKDARTVTFRDTTTGEELTFSYEDIEEGRFSFTSEDGEARFDLDAAEGEEGRMTITTDEGTATFGSGNVAEFPRWVPIYTGSSARGTYASDTPEMRAGAFSFETTDDVDAVLGFYESRLESEGLEIASRTTTPDGALLVAASSDESRSITVTLSSADGGVNGLVNFTEKK